jgi:hypothetical protein
MLLVSNAVQADTVMPTGTAMATHSRKVSRGKYAQNSIPNTAKGADRCRNSATSATCATSAVPRWVHMSSRANRYT